MTRPSREVTMMANALVWATRSTCSSRISVGAVLADASGRVLAVGYNGAPSGQPHCDEVGCEFDSDHHCIRAIHAEENIILNCAKEGVSCLGHTLYTTHSPCPRCCKRIIQAGIKSVVFLEAYGEVSSATRELTAAGVEIRTLDSDERTSLDELLLKIHKVNS